MMSRLGRAFVLALVASFISGCGTLKTSPASLSAPNNDASIAMVDAFVLNGRISVRVGDRLDSARIEWTREIVNNTNKAMPETRESMRFFSPFGAQMAALTSDANGAVLKRGETIEATASSLAELTSRVVGVAIDTTQLAKWVQGVELENAAPVSRDAESNTPRAWKITAENFRAVNASTVQPTLRVASRVTATEGETTLRVVIDEFKPLAEAKLLVKPSTNPAP
jgi:outer membrane biogenesis lipoprotein LolB